MWLARAHCLLGLPGPLEGLPVDPRRFSWPLEGLPVDGPQPLLVVLPFGDPHLLEGVEGGEDAAADPRGVEALLRRRDADLDVLGRELLHLGVRGEEG